jgi:hypothetical protein
LKRGKGHRNESSLGPEVPLPAFGGDADSLEADPTAEAGIDIDFDFDDWSSQIMRPDLPSDIIWPLLPWPLLDTDPLPPLPELNLPSDMFRAPLSPNLAPLLQDYQTANTSFPDTYLLPIPALTLLRACVTIATRLGIAMQVWDCSSKSPFYVGSDSVSDISASSGMGVDVAALPENLRPTRTQRLVPHHPLLDILPWPGVRDKLILFFAQPVGVRPPGLDRGQLVADLEDEAEGVVVRAEGMEPWEMGSWEVGKAIEKRWWFVLDSKVRRRR